PISGPSGNHTLTVYTSAPNGITDDYLNNDTLNSYINIVTAVTGLPFTEDFSLSTFPPAGWQIWNPDAGATNTWTRSIFSGATNPGCAFFDDYNINQFGTLDDLLTLAVDSRT